MESNSVPQGRLNAMQISLLRLFDRNLSDEQIRDLKRVLVGHYSVLLRDEAERVADERSYTDDDFNAMLNSPS